MIPPGSATPVSAPDPAGAAPREPRRRLPAARVIQGGMGSGVSGWRLAQAVAREGQLGVVSGTGLDSLFVRRLQDGDVDGHLRRALLHFPLPSIAEEALARWFRPEGRRAGEAYRPLAPDGHFADAARQRLAVLANFVEVWLAREGHDEPIGLNLLAKIQAPNLASIYGAMLAGVSVVIMGAGIPREIPAALDALAEHAPAAIRLEVEGLRADEAPFLRFDPRGLGFGGAAPLARPAFVPIVSSHVLAGALLRKAAGGIDGLVVESPRAGGHVAPPRGELRLNDRGEPLYGERDAPALEKIAELGLPFWLAGGTGWPDRYRAARAAGASGVQVGTFFAYCEESGLRADLKRAVIDAALAGTVDVVTSASASPTGFPFKVVALPGTLSEPGLAAARRRVCDMGYLRTAYHTPEEGIGFRCPAEPLRAFLAKGGRQEDTRGRHCLCNALMANVGVGQLRGRSGTELPLLTSGDDLRELGRFLAGRRSYTARDVLAHVLG